MLVHLHVKNLALIEETEVEFGPGLNILTGETGAGKSILLGSIQLILGGKTSRSMIRENASYALVELLFQVENTKARESLAALDIYPEDGQVLMSRKIMDGRSINKINGETSTVSQMKAAAACLLDIHGQHEHQSLLYGDRQLSILDVYGKERILPAREKVREAYREYRACMDQLKALDMDEEQRNREKAFLEFEINEIEEAALIPGEDETLEDRYRKLSNARRIMETAQMVHGMTGYEQGAADMTGNALKEFSRIVDYDKELAPLQEALGEIDSLLSDFCRDLSSYMDSLTFDEETFFETEKRLDLINSLKAKYGQTIPEILSYQKEQQEKLEKLQKFEENFQFLKEKLVQSEKILEEASHELSEIRKEYRDWLKRPEKFTAFMTKRMNLPDGSSEIKVCAYERIKATNRPVPVDDLVGRMCTCGIDFSKVTDMISVNLHFRDVDTRYDLNHSWLCLQSKDLPRIKAPWKEWADQGHITLVDDVEIHPELIVDYCNSDGILFDQENGNR